MSIKTASPWIPISKIENLVQLEPALILVGLAFIAWIIKKIFLRTISEERKIRLNQNFKNLLAHLATTEVLFLTFQGIEHLLEEYSTPLLERVGSYIGLAAILLGAVSFIKILRILAFEYLYLSHMKVPFPLLIINLFTLILTAILGAWIASEIFNFQLAPLLATSAIFSLVTGLALQDTLGNLFAGVALQFDKPFEIGDWIEITLNGQKWVGKVNEISWRATVLIAFTDETITVPNRLMSQTQISNFSTQRNPIARSQAFKIPFESPIDEIKKTLIEAGLSVTGIRKDPQPIVLVSETTESWISMKLVYFINDYGAQFLISDEVHSAVINAFEKAGFKFAASRIQLNR